MAYVVTQSCCADASCVVACPVNCIHPAPGEPGFAEAEMLYVDPDTCVGCGACATACPVGAVLPEEWLSESQQPFTALNAEYYQLFPHADRAPLAPVPEQRRLRRPGPFRVAVVGAGPAGLYTADELLKHPEIEAVDVYDRLRTPYGLVRHGVAPDHADTKRVTRLFAAIERDDRFRYFLGVEIGRDVTLDELRARYHAVVYAVGAASDRGLDVPGEDLAGSLPATSLVGWYNGHPDQQRLQVPLDHERAIVVGNGNVALDVARILTADPERLARTDLAPVPLEQLRRSRVREVVVLGRRGPAQAAFTVPELVGLAGLTDVDVVVDADPDEIDATGTAGRLLAELAARPAGLLGDRRRITLRFTTSPVELVGDDHVAAVRVVGNRLVTRDDGSVRAEPTDEHDEIAAGLVVRAVGFRGLPVHGLPHDPATGTVPHDRGRVEPGVYVAGWIKRGPSGFIGTNKSCAAETVCTLLDDLDDGPPDPRGTTASIAAAVRRRCPDLVDLGGWQRIDAAEIARGVAEGRPREKIVDVTEQSLIAHTRRRRLRRPWAPDPEATR